LRDPWDARDGYIDVILDRSPESVARFFSKYSSRELNEAERVTAVKLLEMQRHAMLMYTSCGWFFDEISRPEPVQVIQYAGRVVQLAQGLFGDSIEEKFLKILEQARSNIPEQGDGRRIYEQLVRPAMIEAKVSGSYDERRQVLGDMLESAMSGMEKSFRPLFEHLFPPERLSAELGGPVPRAFQAAEELLLNNELHRAVKSYAVDASKVRNLLDAAGKWQIMIDGEGIVYDFKANLERMMVGLVAAPGDPDSLKRLAGAVSLARSLPFPVDLWKVQNLYWDILQTSFGEFKKRAGQNDKKATDWVEAFISLGKYLSIRVR
jgi:hypothetical protein